MFRRVFTFLRLQPSFSAMRYMFADRLSQRRRFVFGVVSALGFGVLLYTLVIFSSATVHKIAEQAPEGHKVIDPLLGEQDIGDSPTQALLEIQPPSNPSIDVNFVYTEKTIESGDYLFYILAQQTSAQESSAIIESFEQLVPARSIKPGQVIIFAHSVLEEEISNPYPARVGASSASGSVLQPVFAAQDVPLYQVTTPNVVQEPSELVLQRVVYVYSATRHLAVERTPRGWQARWIDVPIVKSVRAVELTIDDSFFAASQRADIPQKVIFDVIRLLSFSVDFQREIWPGAKMHLQYEEVFAVDDGGAPVASREDLVRPRQLVDSGELHFLSLESAGRKLAFHRYESVAGRVEYYDAVGKSARKALMRTPVDATRISSQFGLRKHPVDGYSKLHRGVDFAAPTGTPIYAAGDGVIEYVGWAGGYGNFIRIRHNAEYKTAYAHLSKFAKGKRRGVRVTQGEVIGFVGSTGKSTGPHLHYEVIRHGRPINSMRMELPESGAVPSAELARFLAVRDYQLRTLQAQLSY